MRVNKRAVDRRFDSKKRLAGGYGPRAAVQGADALLRRACMACLLWESLAYESGSTIVRQVKELVPRVKPSVVYDIAVEARHQQKLRHLPLLLAREMARYEYHKELVADLLEKIIMRPDEITEYLAIYWKDGKIPISAQSKRGLARAFVKFDEYQLAKWNNQRREIKLRDVMKLVRPKESSRAQGELWGRLLRDELKVPDTWEVALSRGEDKKQTWTRLIQERKIGALAFLRNLRNMENADVGHEVIRQGFRNLNTRWLLPINYLAAAKYAPRWESEIEDAMLRGFSQAPKLPGKTLFIVDVSGSMTHPISGKSEYNRMQVASAMAIMAREMCEEVVIYATGGNDSRRQHKTALLPPRRGFALSSMIPEQMATLGHGGIFTRQCLEFIRAKEQGEFDRIIVFSDSQDCDLPDRITPAPFGRYNYIVDVSAHTRGINYDGVWTAEVSGWSEHFIKYILAYEGALN